MDRIIPAFSRAAEVWEQALLQLTWFHTLIVAAYLGAAWLCFINGYIAKGAQEAHGLWFVAAAVLCVLGANTALHGDLFLTQVLRSLAKLQGWHGERRLLQDLTIGAMVLLFLFSANWLHARFTADGVPSEPVAIGLAALVVLLVLRTVSAHVTDTVLALRISGVSVGRLVEFAGIGLVLHGALRCLRLR